MFWDIGVKKEIVAGIDEIDNFELDDLLENGLIFLFLFERGRARRPPLPQIMTYALPLWADLRRAPLRSAMEVANLGHEPL